MIENVNREPTQAPSEGETAPRRHGLLWPTLEAIAGTACIGAAILSDDPTQSNLGYIGGASLYFAALLGYLQSWAERYNSRH